MEEAMKYMLLIHQGDTPLPGSEEWERLSEDEQKAIYGDYGRPSLSRSHQTIPARATLCAWAPIRRRG
jgi:hypothetical protein